MRVQVLGCSGAIARDARTTSFLIDDSILIDAGTGVGDLELEALARIDHVFLTHAHLDHVASLPLMLDSVASLRKHPVTAHGLPATIDALKKHLFNHEIWPDFTVIPTPEHPFLRFVPVHVGDAVEIGSTRIEVLPAHHSVPAVGYAVDTPKGQWVFTGDTERNDAFWLRVNRMKLAMLVIETAFSERECDLAFRSRHLCPSVLAAELAKLDYPPDRSVPIGITHTKPTETGLIIDEIASLGLTEKYDLTWLEAGQVFEF